MNRRARGTWYEQLAAGWLQDQGFYVMERNFRSRYGEIDLVAREDSVLVFIEVKYRRNASCGSPLEAVDRRKQVRICRVADWFRCRFRVPADTPCRFDVVAIDSGGIRLVRDAFPYIPAG